MIVIVFRLRLKPDAAENGYSDMAQEMWSRAHEAPGFISIKSFTSEDGERLSLVHWKDAETLAAWRNDQRHRVAQNMGRAQWYEWYSIEIADVTRATEFHAPAKAATGVSSQTS